MLELEQRHSRPKSLLLVNLQHEHAFPSRGQDGEIRQTLLQKAATTYQTDHQTWDTGPHQMHQTCGYKADHEQDAHKLSAVAALFN